MLSPTQIAKKAEAAKKRAKIRAKARLNEVKLAKLLAEEKRLAISGPLPLTLFDMQFCDAYVQTGRQEQAWRQLRPEDKDPGVSAMRMMKRAEIRDQIKAIYAIIGKNRSRAAEISANAALLTLEVADDRLMEVMGTRRRTMGEMLTRDVKQLLVAGATPIRDENDKIVDYQLSPELKVALVEESAPVEDADLLKAIKLTYERRRGIVKAEKPVEVTFIQTMLYRPGWAQKATPQVIEGEV